MEFVTHKQREFYQGENEEMRKLHKKFPMTMEPNLKEGVGGFRNANLVYWIGNILYKVKRIRDIPNNIVSDKEYKEFRISLEFLFRVRSALHLCTGKKEDRLRLELIPQVASYLGYQYREEAHMKFAKKVMMSLKVIKLYTTIWIDSLDDDEKLDMLRPKRIEDTFISLLEQLHDAGDRKFKAHPTFLLSLTRASKPKEIKKDIYPIVYRFCFKPHLYEILQPLMDTNLLGTVITPMKKVINPSTNLTDIIGYTVGIHSLKAVNFWKIGG